MNAVHVMKHTILGKTGLRVSRLGFGCMRLPMAADGKVDRSQAIPMLQKAVELGVNYFDTAIGYCHGDSQRVLGEAMEGRRDRVILSTKNHLHEASADTWWGRLEESLKFLRTDHLDVYNLHGMTWNTWVQHIDTPNGKIRLLQRARDEGLIRHICCSVHDTAEALVKLGKTGLIESITLQYNLLDRSLDEAIYRLKEMNIGVVVMGPVGGGRLGVDSDRIRELTGHRVQNTTEAALRFVLAHPGVCVALSGMSTLAMLDENVRIVADKEPFTAGEIAQIDDEVKSVREKRGVACTACGYCLPCAAGVDIPDNFGIYNEYTIYGLKPNAQNAYAGLTGKAVRCTECGACLPKCPQKINIPHMLQKIVTDLDPQFQGWGVSFAVTGLEADRICARINTKNLTDHPLPATVSIALADGAECNPATFSFTNLAAGTTQSKRVRIFAPAGVGVIDGTVTARAGAEMRTSAIRVPFFLIPHDQMRWHQARLSPADFGGRQEIAAAHSYRVGLRHDDERIFLELDVRSQLHALAAPGESSGGRIEMYVDMRPDDQGFGRAPYTAGVEQFFLALGQTGGYGSVSKKEYYLRQHNQPTADGVRINLELPFAAFRNPGGPIPKRIGLDFMFVACDAAGTDLGYPTYGGNSGLYQNPASFTTAMLV